MWQGMKCQLQRMYNNSCFLLENKSETFIHNNYCYDGVI